VFALVLLAACGSAHVRWRRPEAKPWRAGPAFRLFGIDPAPPMAELRGDQGVVYRYLVQREPSGVESELDAVIMGGEVAYAAGADGVVLRRTTGAGWARETVPTTKRLRALAFGADGAVFAAGDGGTLLRRAANGAWTAEALPLTADLYDLAWRDGRLYAAGNGGTLLARDAAGSWRALATHSDADLRRFDGRVAIGRGGVIIDCTPWDRDQHAQAKQFACVPRPSPAKTDLLAAIGDEEHSVWHAWGAAGVGLVEVKSAPIEVSADPVLAGAPTITAAVANHWWTNVGELATLLVGERGAIVFVSPRSSERPVIVVTGAPDLHGVASEQLDAFAVGAHGTIVHLQTMDVAIPQVFAL
jgi:hypothetical protein